MPYRTIFINARFLTQHITGVQRYAHELVSALDRLIAEQAPVMNGLRLIMLAPPGPLKFRPELEHIELRQVGRFSGHAWEQLSLPFACRDGLLFCPGNAAPLHSLFLGRVIATVHDLSAQYFPTAYSQAFRAVYHILTPAIMRWAKRIITVSQAERQSILAVYPHIQDRLKVVLNGGLSEAWLQRLQNADIPFADTPDEKPYVLYVGSLSLRKNIQGVISAAPHLATHGLSVKVIGGTAKAFQSMTGLDIPDNANIEFLGQIDDTQTLLACYAKAKCLIFPSLYESSGIPPLEAMACGCPVVCSDIPALVERCGDAALYCDPHDPRDIAQKTIQAAMNEALRNRLIKLGQQRVTDFSWKRCAQETVNILRTVSG